MPLAMIQWAVEQNISNLTVVSVDTGFAAAKWDKRVEQAQEYARQSGLHVVRLKSELSLADLIRERGSFPSPQFQWCASHLKGLTVLTWLDEMDPLGQLTVMLALRRGKSLSSQQLNEWIEESPHYGGRRVWQPLYQHGLEQRDALIERAGFEILPHRSLECEPCVNADANDLLRIDASAIKKASALEKEMGGHFLDASLYRSGETLTDLVKRLKQSKKSFKPYSELGGLGMGCGDPFA